MRYVLAIVALAISGVLLLLGIGQRSFLAGPVEIVHSVAVDEETSYAVIDGGEFAKIPGQANIIMHGDEAFAAIAKTRDIEGWVAPFAHEQLTVTPDTREVQSTTVRAESPVSDLLEVDDSGSPILLDPRGSDLWLEARAGEDSMFRMPVNLAENQSILFAGTGADPLPSGTSLVWVQDRATPWAGPLFVAGGAFALLGALLYLIAFDRDKRALGPRRGRRGPLLGVQNVVRGARVRKTDQPDLAPQKGALSDIPETQEIVADSSDTTTDDTHRENTQEPGKKSGENHAE